MPDLDDVLGGPRLRDLDVHVADVLRLHLPAGEEFQPGSVVLSAYDFVPYALSGLAAARRTPTRGLRPTTEVTLPLTDDAGGREEVARQVTLLGPGDVARLDPRQVLRRYPAPGSATAEETFHAHVELDRPEVPWAFGANEPADRMLPWLVLVVLETGEVSWEPPGSSVNHVMTVDASCLPDLSDSWSTAHAQVAGGPASVASRLSPAHAPANLSRLLASRILTQDTEYVACIVPATDAGVRAGLGSPGSGTLGPAWRRDDGPVRLPVYDRWQFRTAPDGDFPRLARRLRGVPAPWHIGRRVVDTSVPGEPLEPLAVDEAGRRQVLRCALFSPNDAPAGSPAEDAAWSDPRVGALRAEAERPAALEGRATATAPEVDDWPVVGVRLYAQGQRGAATLPDPADAGTDWFAQLNLHPLHRVVAGLGTRVVVRDQEQLMQAAWAQVGEVERANRELARAQLAQALARRLHARTVALDGARLLMLSRPVAARVGLPGDVLTVHGRTRRSATPPSALGGAFRRTVRANGRLARLAPDPRQVLDVVAPGGVARDFRREVRVPQGLRGLSPEVVGTLDPLVVAQVSGRPPEQAGEAMDLLRRHADVMASAPTLASALREPTGWGQPDLAVRPGEALASRVTGALTSGLTDALAGTGGGGGHGPHGVTVDVVRSRWLGSLAAGLASVEGLGLRPELQRLSVRTVDVLSPRRLPGTGLRGRLVGPWRPPAGRPGAPPSVEQQVRSLLTPRSRALADQVRSALDLEVGQVRDALLAEATNGVLGGVLGLATTPARDRLAVPPEALLDRLDPDRTVTEAVAGRLTIRPDDRVRLSPWQVGPLVAPIMAAPRFDRAMYRALVDLDREWLVPGLAGLAEDDMVTVLEANDTFVEAFLVGLSDEMARELLWRLYPTDQRGTYFHRFWSADRDELRTPLHRFGTSPLGTHVGAGGSGGGPPGSGRAVVVVRGEVVRRYPDLVVSAMRAVPRGPAGQTEDESGRPFLPETDTDRSVVAPTLFVAPMEPDVLMTGLDVSTVELRSGGWWIVVSEHPQAPRFRHGGADLVGHEVRFAPADGAHGGDVAARRLVHPARVAFEAEIFLDDTEET